MSKHEQTQPNEAQQKSLYGDRMTNGEDSNGPGRQHTSGAMATDHLLPAASGQHGAPKTSRGPFLTLIVVVLVAAVIAGAVGILGRVHARKQLTEYTDANAAPTGESGAAGARE